MTIVIENANIVMETETITGGSLTIDGGKIVRIGQHAPDPDSAAADKYDARGAFIYPGFIDLHVHGGNGFDLMDATPEAIEGMCHYHAAHGTTTLLPTTRTAPIAAITSALTAAKAYMASSQEPLRSLIAGIHLEGPFLASAYRGAQFEQELLQPSLPQMKEWLDASGGQIRLVTIAPELDGAESVIRHLREQNIIVSAGHSGATYEDMIRAAGWGVQHVTHCYNGMRGFHHREPGMLAAAWLDERVTAELIFDTHHAHPAAAQVLLHMKGLDRVVLITDAVRPAGLPNGKYITEAGDSLTVEAGIVRLPTGSLAGSTLTMNIAVKNAIELLGLKPYEAARLASLNPARILGLNQRKGSLAPGKDADLVVLNERFEVQRVMSLGHWLEL
ncbi:N-acetylglucosamine-6-phosphate deacetylase [Paenibacillus sp. J2TS4]|uniref:N-acetylglucosamine-6-phosphate deacetylase n=1 Tax=Paenibacillus sp. J2TS4 TaxID=2807194 RepID=UPI001B1FA946|nr:N-acetylglucosamine-6-phosphate deacetylase [Paenibacillus sp. J2TS4]GIP35276.1 N-acetylglucosamine-6-phosphate deacetylase [Paenibacillus sp. J2TS4]